MELITGYGGEAHVTAEQDGSLYAGLFGADEYILPIGKQMAAEAVTANTVRVYDGSAVMKGRHWWIKPDTYVDFEIENGTSGYLRNDILVAKYQKDPVTGIETIEYKTKMGAVGATAKDPSYVKGDIRYGATENEMPLYRVCLNGVNVSSIARISPIIPSITGLKESISSNVSSLTTKINTLNTDLTKKITALDTATAASLKTLKAGAAKEYYAKGLRIVRGTKVIKPSASSNRHTLFSKFKSTYGVDASVVVTNGHIEANSYIVMGTSYSHNKDILYVYLNGATNVQFRVNYTIIYNA